MRHFQWKRLLGHVPIIVSLGFANFSVLAGPKWKAKVLGLVNGFAVEIRAKNIRAFENSPWIEYVTVDPIVRPTGKPPKDSGDSGEPWESVGMSGNPVLASIGLEQYYEVKKIRGVIKGKVRNSLGAEEPSNSGILGDA